VQPFCPNKGCKQTNGYFIGNNAPMWLTQSYVGAKHALGRNMAIFVLIV